MMEDLCPLQVSAPYIRRNANEIAIKFSAAELRQTVTDKEVTKTVVIRKLCQIVEFAYYIRPNTQKNIEKKENSSQQRYARVVKRETVLCVDQKTGNSNVRKSQSEIDRDDGHQTKTVRP